MTDGFAGFGLTDVVVEATRTADLLRPTPIQAAAIPVLRRGANAVLHASSGSGVTAAIGLPLLDRLASEPADAGVPRALVIVPTRERAESVVESLIGLGAGLELRIRAIGPGWRAQDADVLATTAQRALEAIETSELKLEGVQTLAVLDASGVFELNGKPSLETIVALVPKDAQRIVATAELTADIERFTEAHVRKALSIPPRPAVPARAALRVKAPDESAVRIGYMVVRESSKGETVARLIEAVTDSVRVFTRTERRADTLLQSLVKRGIADGVRDIRVQEFGASDETAAAVSRVISADVPFSAEDLSRIHASGGTVLVTARELEHLKRIAGEASLTLKQRRPRSLDDAAIGAFRNVVRSALDTEDIDAQLLLLDPLLEDHSAEEIAGALSALLRRRGVAVGPAAAVTTAAAAESGTAGAPPAESTTGGFTRLFISIGERDNIRPGDLVGAITGEARIKGEQVGRIDIRDSFSVVEVATAVAERVIRALNGTTMRGRSLRVDFDRKTGASGARAPRGEGGPRAPRTPRGPGDGARPRGGPRSPRGGPRTSRPDR